MIVTGNINVKDIIQRNRGRILMNDHRLDMYRYAIFNVGRGSGKIGAAYRIAGKFLNELKQKQKGENMFSDTRCLPYIDWNGENIRKNPEEVKITKAHNGWIVKIGCATFVETSWKKICAALKEYWDDPVKAEKKYYKK
jgi:hypothetical protein